MREGEERKLKKLKEEERLAEERMAEETALSLAQCNDKSFFFLLQVAKNVLPPLQTLCKDFFYLPSTGLYKIIYYKIIILLLQNQNYFT